MENNWQRICDDIEHGTITLADDLFMDDTLRDEIQDGLDADPKRAEEVRRFDFTVIIRLLELYNILFIFVYYSITRTIDNISHNR